jgi:hypothetical protein
LDYLTWQSRRLWLMPELDDAGRTVVRRVILMKGAQLPDGYYTADYEQMLAFKRSDKSAPNQEPYVVVGFREDRVFWRDSQALLDTFDASTHQPPGTVSWLHEVASAAAGELEHGGDRPPQLDLLGLTGSKAKLLFWRHERLPLPLAYLRDRYLVQALEQALAWADKGDEALQYAVNRLATLALVPDNDQGGWRPDRKLVDSLAAHLDAGRAYWSALEAPFKRLMLDLPNDTQPGGQQGYGAVTLPAWQQRIRRAARAALLSATSGFNGSGRTLKAAATAERALDYRLMALLGGPRDRSGEVMHATN